MEYVQTAIIGLATDRKLEEIVPQKIVRKELEKFLYKRGLSQKQFADKLGVSYSAVSKWLHTEAEPRTGVVCTIMQKFDIEWDEATGLFDVVTDSG